MNECLYLFQREKKEERRMSEMMGKMFDAFD